jgi:hypothetical protein
MKPLSTTEIEVLQKFADGFGITEFAGPQDNSAGNQESLLSGISEAWADKV